jgi:hypothetical protein
VVCRLLNSRYDPRRMIRAIGLPLQLQEGLQTCVEQIVSAQDLIELSHAHGRALGLSTGFGMVNAITHTHFNLLGEIYQRAFDDRLIMLKRSAFILSNNVFR